MLIQSIFNQSQQLRFMDNRQTV